MKWLRYIPVDLFLVVGSFVLIVLAIVIEVHSS